MVILSPRSTDIFAIDPGPEVSSWLRLDPVDMRIVAHAEEKNSALLHLLRGYGVEAHRETAAPTPRFVVEIVEGYGMSVGVETFATCELIGRISEILELARVPLARLGRKAVKLELCSVITAKDKDIKAAAIACWGSEEIAVGKKKNPGPLYGIVGDRWQALGLALAYMVQSQRAENKQNITAIAPVVRRV